MQPLRQPILCYITDRLLLKPPASGTVVDALKSRIGEMLAAGADWIQIREKDLTGGALCGLVSFALDAAASQGSLAATGKPQIIVNDRLDVALATGAGGVHLGESSLPVAAAKKLVQARAGGLGESHAGFRTGVSCHSLAAVKQAEADGADYAIFGPVFSTPSKVRFGPPQGLARLEEVCRAVGIPILAVGGVTIETVASCIAAGASGIAAIRLFQDAAEPAATIESLRASCRSR